MFATIVVPIQEHIGNAPLDIGVYISNIIGVALTLAAIATLIFLVWGGISWITAGSNEKGLEAARNRITGAIVGLAIVAVSWAIFLILDHVLGLGIANKTTTYEFPEVQTVESDNPSGPLTSSNPNPKEQLPIGTNVSAACKCNNGGCAQNQAMGYLSSGDCRRCTLDGWKGTDIHQCLPITCYRCP